MPPAGLPTHPQPVATMDAPVQQEPVQPDTGKEDDAKRHKALEKSFDSLQRIHAIVFALSVGEAIRRVLSVDDATHQIVVLYQFLPQFLAFLITVVPFYHGSHRHLEKTYVFSPTVRHKWFVMVDFLKCLLEACAFFALALAIKEQAFFIILTSILFFNFLWGLAAAWANHTQSWKWSTINICTTAIFLTLSFPVFRDYVNPLLEGIIADAYHKALVSAIVFVVLWDAVILKYNKEKRNERLKPLLLSVVSVVLVLLFSGYAYDLLNANPVWQSVVFAAIAFIRTFLDYAWSWDFYFPYGTTKP